MEFRRVLFRSVAGRGIVVHLAAVAPDVVLPPADALDQLLADGARGGAPGQQMLGAVDLRRLAQDGGAAVAHQQVGRGAQRRIGGDARIAVGAAALQGYHQLARSEEHTSELQSLMRISYAVFCLKKKST